MARQAIHPGEHLAEQLEALDMSAAELARQLKVPTNRITHILNGQRAVTGDTALRLGHFFGTSHTLARYRNAFYSPILSDWRNYENWRDDGARTATQRANEIWKKLLAEYEKPPIDPAVEEELEAYVARRKEEIGRNGA